MTITLRTMPPSTNHLYQRSGRGVFLLPKVREAKEAIAREGRGQYRGKPLTGPLAVEISLFWGDRRKHDIDNLKALLDACTGILWADDGQIDDLHTIKAFDKANPRVEMRVWEL